ncbi:hypothetical protein MMC28_008694 [Mycoblastus sanguinarius]|nr:hypothetical protein [Mycoblastus sanguinarius]
MGETPGKMYALATVLTLLALVTIILRFYARNLKKAGLWWDDYMILPAMLFTIGTAICMFVGSALGDLGRHTEISPHRHPIFTQRTVIFEQISYASQLTLTLTLAFTKLAVLLFYKRIFKGPLITAAVWTMIGVVIVWAVAFFFSNLLQCWPISLNWTAFGSVPSGCIETNVMYIAQAYSDVFTDVIILSLPLPCIWAMKMPIKHRIAVSGIFLLGVLTVGAGVAKLVVFRQIAKATLHHAVDVTYLLTPTVYWPMVESSLGIVGACLPLLRPLFAGASTRGMVRELRSVAIPSSAQSDTDFKHTGDVGTSAGGFSSASTLQFNSHGLLEEKPTPKASVSSLNDNADRGMFARSVREADDRV